MGWGTIGGMIGGSIGSAISNALKGNGSSKPSSGGSGSSGGSSGTGRLPSINGSGAHRPGGSSGSSGAQSPSGGSGGGGAIDYSTAFNNAISRGNATADELQGILNDRWAKAQTPEYSQFRNDQFQYDAQNYVNNLRKQEQERQAAYVDYPQQMLDTAARERDAAIAQGKQSLQQQLPGIQQSYDDAARQAYIQYMNTRRDLPQQLAAAGISGQGAAESTISGQQNAYQNALSQSEQARRNAEQQIQNQMANLEATGNLQYAQNASDISKLTFQAYQDYLRQQQQRADADRQFALQAGGLMGSYGGAPTFDNQKWQDEKNQSAQAQAYERYMQQYQQAFQRWSMLGTVANEADAAILGIPVGTAHADERYRRAELALDQYLAHRK